MSDERSPEELLQSALSSAFTPVSLAPEPPSSSPKPDSGAEITATAAAEAAATSAPAPLVSQEDLAKHDEERAALERSWHEQSAIQRKEAEERRTRIAAERASSGETWEKLDEGKPLRGPPNQMTGSSRAGAAAATATGSGYPGSPSPADVRGVVSGEPSGSRHIEVSAQVSPRTTATLEHSQRWEEIEDVPSMESSYPSLSFPEHSDSAPSDNAGSKSKSTEKPAPVALPSATLSVFDSRLSTRSRVIALFSSLSINLFLPFVNGVMLGFGEIFARNMAFRFFGWEMPGGAATAVGVNAARRRK